MQKIVTLFCRNYDGDRMVRDEVVPGAEWVPAGEGVATQKLDGTCCLVRGGKLYKRHEVKPGGTPPPNFEPADDADAETGKQQGWVPVGDGPEDHRHREAFARMQQSGLHPGLEKEFTCELLGPKVQGNPERMEAHVLLAHGSLRPIDDCPRTFAALREWFRGRDIEGVVWHHPDGRMAKIKKRDFGMRRKD